MKLFAGKKGVWHDSKVGKIYCSKAPKNGIEARLYRDLVEMVDECRFSIVINSVDTGKHVPTSRHYDGRAVDINDIHIYGEAPFPVSLANPHARDAVNWLVGQGYVTGHENGPYDALLLGPAGTKWNETKIDHSTHLHASIHR